MWSPLGAVVIAAVYIAGVYCALRAAQTARTPQGAVGWVVFLLILPFLAVPAYLVFGQHRYHGYYIARRESARVTESIKNFNDNTAPDPDSLEIDLAPFEYCADLPAARGNTAELLIDGQAAFEAIFRAIDAAKSYVLVQFYLVQDDTLGRSLQKHMIDAAGRGVTVRLMVDPIASFALPGRYINELTAAGVVVADQQTRRLPWSRLKINFRNHRKTVIVDGTLAFTGGLNVGDQYLGTCAGLAGWRDTHVQFSGPMVTQLQLIFAEDWHWQTGDLLIEALNWSAPQHEDGVTGLIVATGPGDTADTGSMMFFSAIAAARKRIWIASPYFVPDIDIVSALRHAALRGVDVRLLVPDESDHLLVGLAAFAFFDDIREAGVRVFRYTKCFTHQKVFVVDDTLAGIGTTNLDNRSFRLNFETMAMFFDSGMAQAVDEMLRDDFEESYELKLTLSEQRALIRYGAPVSRLFSPLL